MAAKRDLDPCPLYTRLVFAAYLLLASIRDPRTRLRRAHRLATAAIPRGLPEDAAAIDQLYWKILGRVARRVTGLRSRFQLGFTNWAAQHTQPDDVEQLVLDAHLASASAGARLGYLLLSAENLAPDDAAARLVSLNVSATGEDVIAAGQGLQELLAGVGISARRQRELLTESAGYIEISHLAPPSANRLRARSALRWAWAVVPLVAVLLVSFLVLPGLRQVQG
ncbi:MAG: hypothetical protein ACRDPW_04465, partial [Mycobacteriales bacterium]